MDIEWVSPHANKQPYHRLKLGTPTLVMSAVEILTIDDIYSIQHWTSKVKLINGPAVTTSQSEALGFVTEDLINQIGDEPQACDACFLVFFQNDVPKPEACFDVRVRSAFYVLSKLYKEVFYHNTSNFLYFFSSGPSNTTPKLYSRKVFLSS